MRLTHDPLPRAAWQGVMRLVSARCSVHISGAVVRRFRSVVPPRPGRTPEYSWETQAG
jgi:hypothetical protein